MNFALPASYTHCQRIARRSASSFYYSFSAVAQAQTFGDVRLVFVFAAHRRPGRQLGNGRRAPRALGVVAASLVDATRGEHDDPLLPALADTIENFQVPVEYLHAVIDGVEMDLEPVAYDTFDNCSATATTWPRPWGSRACTSGVATSRREQPARQCGVAFQMTNILRD